MAKITKIIRAENRGAYCIVHVLVDDEDEAQVMVGGEVEVWFEPKYDRALAWVKKKPDVIDKPKVVD